MNLRRGFSLAALVVVLMVSFFCFAAFADEYKWDFSQLPTNQIPPGCLSIVGGQGGLGSWKVLMDEFPLPMAPLSPNAPSTAPKAVVGQTAWEPVDEHFPMLQLGTNSYGDFKFSTRFKIVDGVVEQMAGVAFRLQDTRNYYYVRASALGNTFYFYKVQNGERQPPIGNELPISKGVWHELVIECTGPKINILLDGKAALPTLTDLTYSSGRIALWTKSDSVSYFADPRITYTPKIPFVKHLVAETLKEYDKLMGLQVVKVDAATKKPVIIASMKDSEVGQPGESTDAECVANGQNYYRKQGSVVYVTMPLRDRNGEPVAAARFIMKSQTAVNARENALIRANPILKSMQTRVSAVDNLD